MDKAERRKIRKAVNFDRRVNKFAYPDDDDLKEVSGASRAMGKSKCELRRMMKEAEE